ncbi:hypothetical protein E2C01_012331 [Portunus trituberculatus]|uniref:Uncharacterized protein n=1 Tax=Portunus trituberculatus TaxID=210409 RepID=A0A5B7DE90_PORTR|nr:hypothetical protein [Portunus trituberculatus]
MMFEDGTTMRIASVFTTITTTLICGVWWQRGSTCRHDLHTSVGLVIVCVCMAQTVAHVMAHAFRFPERRSHVPQDIGIMV